MWNNKILLYGIDILLSIYAVYLFFYYCIFRCFKTYCTVKLYHPAGKSVPLKRLAVPNGIG